MSFVKWVSQMSVDKKVATFLGVLLILQTLGFGWAYLNIPTLLARQQVPYYVFFMGLLGFQFLRFGLLVSWGSEL